MKVEYDLKKIIYRFQKEICYFSQLQALAVCQYQKDYYQKMINQRTDTLVNVMRKVTEKSKEEKRDLNRQKEFTLEELANYDGANGRPAYAAVNGTVYDVSREPAWGGGTHFGLYAGKDLTAQFTGCHQGMMQILNKLPKVGVLKK